MPETPESKLPRRRFRLWPLLAIPLCGVAATTSWWLQKSYPTAEVADIASLGLDSPLNRYRSEVEPKENSLTKDLTQVFDRLAVECLVVDEEIERTETQLRAADPHLDQL